MEIQLQELIDQIKKDGVEAAEDEAKVILENAKAEAERIVADAKAEADKILLSAKMENERMVKSSEDAIRQAGRNLLISFRESVAKELQAVAGENVAAAFSSDRMADLIIKVVEKWAENPDTPSYSYFTTAPNLECVQNRLRWSTSGKAPHCGAL